MWVPASVIEWFHISKQVVDSQREDLAAVRAERDILKLQLASSQNHFDWLRVRVNILEAERTQLIEKAYGIKIPVPEIVRTPVVNPLEMNNALFEDVGDDTAKTLGLPQYN